MGYFFGFVLGHSSQGFVELTDLFEILRGLEELLSRVLESYFCLVVEELNLVQSQGFTFELLLQPQRLDTHRIQLDIRLF